MRPLSKMSSFLVYLLFIVPVELTQLQQSSRLHSGCLAVSFAHLKPHSQMSGQDLRLFWKSLVRFSARRPPTLTVSSWISPIPSGIF